MVYGAANVGGRAESVGALRGQPEVFALEQVRVFDQGEVERAPELVAHLAR